MASRLFLASILRSRFSLSGCGAAVVVPVSRGGVRAPVPTMGRVRSMVGWVLPMYISNNEEAFWYRLLGLAALILNIGYDNYKNGASRREYLSIVRGTDIKVKRMERKAEAKEDKER